MITLAPPNRAWGRRELGRHGEDLVPRLQRCPCGVDGAPGAPRRGSDAPDTSRERMSQHMRDTVNRPAKYAAGHAVFSLYASRRTTGTTVSHEG